MKTIEDYYNEAVKQIQLENDNLLEEIKRNNGKKSRQGMTRLLDIATGNVGLALFIPFNWEAFEPLVEDEDTTGSVSSSDHSLGSSSDEDPVVAHEEGVESCPPILSPAQMRQIHSKGLPPSVSLMTWNRVYSLERDGDCFQTMIKKCAQFQHTLIVIETTKGEILGGYADTPWVNQKTSNTGKSSSFFGGGRTFLYATQPSVVGELGIEPDLNQDEDKNSIKIYRWTGVNDYSQICDLNAGSLGMGGGGAFGFYVQDNFTIGSSGSCDTFRSPPLTRSEGGSFEVLGCEVYGFTSMSERLFSLSTPTSSFVSVNSSLRSITSVRSVSSLLE